MLAYHGLNIAAALLDLYPNIGLERSKLMAQGNTDIKYSL